MKYIKGSVWIGQNVYAADDRYFVSVQYFVPGTKCINSSCIAVCNTYEEAQAAKDMAIQTLSFEEVI